MQNETLLTPHDMVAFFIYECAVVVLLLSAFGLARLGHLLPSSNGLFQPFSYRLCLFRLGGQLSFSRQNFFDYEKNLPNR